MWKSLLHKSRDLRIMLADVGKIVAMTDGNVPLQVEIPESVRRLIKLRAATDGDTMRTCVLKALRAYGIKVSEDDLTDRRRRHASDNR